ncbi:MAG TPA: RnfABCDGE type electron transport complex subunit D [Bryobacteraceae bacterium]|jgi:Na+-transporting NADH:ubiquinone oxidoreductase subunit NqrB|nr:RnfABCDGE type electron transport complex subunit D [Bryobacteraceae bacterium]
MSGLAPEIRNQQQTAARQRSPLARFFAADNRYLPPAFITLILLVSQLSFGLLESLSRTLLAIAVSMGCDFALALLIYRKIPNLASAYITGISVGILLRSPEFWPYTLCSVLAIMSKYVLRWRGRHLWNPSNFAISAMLLLTPEYVATLSVQWGNTIWPMLIVWALGVLIVLRVKRFHITATYVVSFVVLAWIRTFFTGHPFLAEVAPITGPMYQLFIFFMITDPRTTVKPRWAQCLVALLVAVVEMILRLFENVHAPYYALAIVGPIANAVEIAITTRKRTPVPERLAVA